MSIDSDTSGPVFVLNSVLILARTWSNLPQRVLKATIVENWIIEILICAAFRLHVIIVHNNLCGAFTLYLVGSRFCNSSNKSTALSKSVLS